MSRCFTGRQFHCTQMQQVNSLVDNTGKKGAKIIHAPLIIDPEHKKGWFAWLTFGKVFTKGTRKVEITEGLFKEGDILVTGRYAFDAFVKQPGAVD